MEEPALVPCLPGLSDVPGDPINGVDDVSGEERERAEDGDRDYGQNNAVLRHRLPIFALAKRSKKVKKLQHLIHLPSLNQACLAARQRTTTHKWRKGSALVVGACENWGKLSGHAVKTSKTSSAWPRRLMAQSLPLIAPGVPA